MDVMDLEGLRFDFVHNDKRRRDVEVEELEDIFYSSSAIDIEFDFCVN